MENTNTSVHIKIPELEAFNGSAFNACKAFYSLFCYEHQRLKLKYPSNAVNDILGYKTYILEKILHNIYSYFIVVEHSKDFIVASSIVRIIADNIASYILIYHTTPLEEMYLRHFLFIIDGAIQKSKIIEKHPFSQDNRITPTEYKALRSNIDKTIDNLNKAITFCQDSIKGLPLYKGNKNIIDKLLIKGNWRYKSITSSPKEYISWNKMHSYISSSHNNLVSDWGDYLSQYIHGLSISNITIDTSSDKVFEELSSLVLILSSHIHKFINEDFNVDESYLLDGFIDSENIMSYMSYCSEKHIQEILNNKGMMCT